MVEASKQSSCLDSKLFGTIKIDQFKYMPYDNNLHLGELDETLWICKKKDILILFL